MMFYWKKNDVSKDPICPVYDSKVQRIIEKQTRYAVGSIHMNIIACGVEAIGHDILRLKK